MDVRTTRFGVIQIAEDRVITFPKGLLGFAIERLSRLGQQRLRGFVGGRVP